MIKTSEISRRNKKVMSEFPQEEIDISVTFGELHYETFSLNHIRVPFFSHK